LSLADQRSGRESNSIIWRVWRKKFAKVVEIGLGASLNLWHISGHKAQRLMPSMKLKGEE